jgi:hypothetical protein
MNDANRVDNLALLLYRIQAERVQALPSALVDGFYKAKATWTWSFSQLQSVEAQLSNACDASKNEQWGRAETLDFVESVDKKDTDTSIDWTPTQRYICAVVEASVHTSKPTQKKVKELTLLFTTGEVDAPLPSVLLDTNGRKKLADLYKPWASPHLESLGGRAQSALFQVTFKQVLLKNAGKDKLDDKRKKKASTSLKTAEKVAAKAVSIFNAAASLVETVQGKHLDAHELGMLTPVQVTEAISSTIGRLTGKETRGKSALDTLKSNVWFVLHDLVNRTERALEHGVHCVVGAWCGALHSASREKHLGAILTKLEDLESEDDPSIVPGWQNVVSLEQSEAVAARDEFKESFRLMVSQAWFKDELLVNPYTKNMLAMSPVSL